MSVSLLAQLIRTSSRPPFVARVFDLEDLKLCARQTFLICQFQCGKAEFMVFGEAAALFPVFMLS